jgi:hypothetical protein
MKDAEHTYKRVTQVEATKIMCFALSNWKIKYHYTTSPEYAELDLENPTNKDLMEIHLNNDKLDQIVIYTDTDTVTYDVEY